MQKISDEEIREIFLANGFSIKDGQTDLKPYVYAAARSLLEKESATTESVSCNIASPGTGTCDKCNEDGNYEQCRYLRTVSGSILDGHSIVKSGRGYRLIKDKDPSEEYFSETVKIQHDEIVWLLKKLKAHNEAEWKEFFTVFADGYVPKESAWHAAVLNECMLIEAAYVEADPKKTLEQLINWHVMNERESALTTPVTKSKKPAEKVDEDRYIR